MAGLALYAIKEYNYSGFSNHIAAIVLFIILLLFSIFLHEISHAFMAISYGAFVPEIGFKIKNINQNMAFPVFYTSIIGKKDINKTNTIKLLLAGPMANLFLAGISLIFYSYNNGMFFIAAVLNVCMFLSNFTTLLHTDGYLILEEILNTKNLDKETFQKLFSKNKRQETLSKANIIYLFSCIISILIYFSLLYYVLNKL